MFYLTVANFVSLTADKTLTGNIDIATAQGYTFPSMLGGYLKIETGVTLTLDAASSISNDSLIVVDGTLIFDGTHSGDGFIYPKSGVLKRNTSAGLIPVGIASDYPSTDNFYAPITLNSNTSGDVLSVSLSDIFSYEANAECYDKSVNIEWKISEAVSGGNDGTITLQWPLQKEGSTFDRNNNLKVANYEGSNTMPTSLLDVSVTGSDPYSVNFNTPAAFGTTGTRLIVGNEEAFSIYTKFTENTDKLDVFPTIANRVLNFTSGKLVNGYEIYSLAGKQIAKAQLNSRIGEIHLSNIPCGTYILKLYQENKISIVKFEIMK